MAKPQIDQQVITKIRAICAGEADHVTLMAVVASELFHAVDGFDWVGFYRVVTPSVLKLGPYQGGHGCLVIPFDNCLLYTSPSPRDGLLSRMPSSA